VRRRARAARWHRPRRRRPATPGGPGEGRHRHPRCPPIMPPPAPEPLEEEGGGLRGPPPRSPRPSRRPCRGPARPSPPRRGPRRAAAAPSSDGPGTWGGGTPTSPRCRTPGPPRGEGTPGCSPSPAPADVFLDEEDSGRAGGEQHGHHGHDDGSGAGGCHLRGGRRERPELGGANPPPDTPSTPLHPGGRSPGVPTAPGRGSGSPGTAAELPAMAVTAPGVSPRPGCHRTRGVTGVTGTHRLAGLQEVAGAFLLHVRLLPARALASRTLVPGDFPVPGDGEVTPGDPTAPIGPDPTRWRRTHQPDPRRWSRTHWTRSKMMEQDPSG